MFRRPHRSRRRLTLARLLVIVVVALALAQAVPYGRTHANPPVRMAARFPDAGTRELFRRGCQSCHSNLTDWPWYANAAPASWLVMHDVQSGRARFDVSEWNRAQPPLSEVEHAVLSGDMPPIQYKIVHGDARLSQAQRRRLVAGLRRLYATDPPRRISHRHPG